MSRVRRQHWIPKMILKEWVNEGNLLYRKNGECLTSNYNEKKNSFSNDPFFKRDFYERDHLETNYTEKNLAWIESQFKPVLEKVKKASTKVKLSRREIEILKTFLFTMTSRTMAMIKRFDELDGDELFKKMMADLTIEERREKLFSSIDITIELAREKLKGNPSLPSKEVIDLTEKLNGLQLGSVLRTNERTSLKFFYSKNEEFLLTDLFESNIMNPNQIGGFLIGLHPITPNICVGLLFENQIMRSAAKQGLDLFASGKKYVSEYLSINERKLFQFDGKQTYREYGTLSYDDKFTYKFNFLSNEEASIFNAFLLSQHEEIVCYYKNENLLNSIQAKEKLGIERKEKMTDIYGNIFEESIVNNAMREIIDVIDFMLQQGYREFLLKNSCTLSNEEFIKKISSPVSNYYEFNSKILEEFFEFDDLEKDKFGLNCLNDKSLGDPEKIIKFDIFFLLKILDEIFIADDVLMKFEDMGSGTSEQGKNNGPDWIFTYSNFLLGIEITSNIIPIYTSIFSDDMKNDDIERITNSVLIENNVKRDEVIIEKRKNRFNNQKIDLIIRRDFSKMDFEKVFRVFEEVVIEKIKKKKTYIKTDRLILIIQSTSFDLEMLNDESELFGEIEKRLNSKYEDEMIIYIH